MKGFNLVNARTVDEAVKLLKGYKGKAKLIAGGTELLGELKDRALPAYPEALINIKTIPDMGYIREEAGVLKIGALTKLREMQTSPVVKEKYKILAQAALSVASPQIRNMGTVGGNLCQDVRCWYYRYPHQVGGRIMCHLKGGKGCYALNGENQYHSIFGGSRAASPPCSLACPGNVDIPSYLSKVREGDLREATEILLDSNPMPSITGRVCPHSCEQECNRGDFDEPVSVRDVERFMGDYILEHANEIIKSPEKKTGQKVAIVGSGPAGLTAAYYLAKRGHAVTVFEASPKIGGMMRLVIPDYRLPKDVLDAEIEKILRIGVEAKVNTDVQSIDDLFQQGYDAVFLALGAHSSTKMRIKGESLSSVMDGMSFLSAVNLGERVNLGDRVAVIGGGNTAIDSARVALRLGAKEVTIVYRRTRAEMPASGDEVEEALSEGIKVVFLATPTEIKRAKGQLELVCTRMELGEPDASGRRQPVPVARSEFSEYFDSVIAAVGQTPDIPGQFGLRVRRQKTLQVDPDTQATDRQGVWAGGDVVTGSATVISAIAAGKRAAASIDRYLTGAEAATKDKATGQTFLKFNNEYLKKTSKAKAPTVPLSDRSLDVEDTFGLGLTEMETEANRCFNCSCLAVNTSDIGVVLVALEAKVKIAGPEGIRIIPINDFFGSLGNVLGTEEVVTEIQVTRPPEKAKQAFLKFRLREAVDFAIVSVASVIDSSDGVCQDARIALGAVAPAPVRAAAAEQAVKGKAIDVATAEAASAAAVAGAIPLSENAYKVEIARALVKRALLS
ncbi:MAG TPA: FAD-dependent oxidoreductase [Dehalococcoidia bacterium]|nr:FAD-dependent oxidoreductase [Dehalococcoidia bacterium]